LNDAPQIELGGQTPKLQTSSPGPQNEPTGAQAQPKVGGFGTPGSSPKA
jgi:hypothetical protein